MNRFIGTIVLTFIICCTACRSWHMNEHRNPNHYTGFHRSFDMTEWKYHNNEGRWYRLELYDNGNFSFSEIAGSHTFKHGRGMWYDVGDYIILDFNRYDGNQKRRELQESLTGCTTIKCVCMVLKKKGRKDLKILPSNAVLRRSY